MTTIDFSKFVDALADAVVASDVRDQVVYANRAVERLLGWPASELVGRPLTTLMPERMRPQHEIGYHHYVSTRQPRIMGKPVRVPALHRDGHEVDIELTLSSFGEGAAEVIVASLRDLGERVELERQLRVGRYMRAATEAAALLTERLEREQVLSRSVEVLHDLFDAALSRIWVFEPESNQLVLRASAGLSTATEDSSRARIDVATYPYKIGQVARTRRPFAKNLSDDAAVDEQFDRDWLAREKLKAVAVLPLLSGGELLGVMACFFGRPLEDEVFEVLGTLGALLGTVLADVRLTERIELERSRLHRLFMQAPALIALTRGSEHRFEMANPLYEKVVGRTELVGRTFAELFPEMAGRGMQQILDGVYASGQPFEAQEFPARLDRRGDGTPEEIFFNFVIQATRDADGRIDGLLSHAVEVTGEVRARRKVAEQQQWLEGVLDHLPIPLLLIEPGTAGVLFANEQARRMGGAALTAPPGPNGERGYFFTDDHGRVLPPDEWPSVRASRGEDVRGFQLSWHTSTGVYAVLGSAVLLPAVHGHPATVAVPFLDVTRLQKMENELLAAVNARDEFLSIASHELKTPLTALQLQVEGLRRAVTRAGSEPLPQDKLFGRLDVIDRQVERLGRLVSDLLDVSRASAGRLQLEPESLELAQLLREVTQRFELELERAGCRLELRTPGPVVGSWDRMRLEQVVSNLLSNAIKYGSGKPIEISLDRRGSEARLVVADHGIGIAPEDQSRIFDRFARAVSERNYGGLGLGLWIVRRFVEAMNGSISVESSPGEGATFTVRLPVVQA